MNGRAIVLGLCCVIGMSAGVNVVLAEESPAGKPNDDPFIGDYVGTFQTIGENGGKPKPEDGPKFKAQKKCGTCHTEASVRRPEKEYILTMDVEHGKDKQGNPKKQRFTLKGEAANDRLTFQDANYTIIVTGGKASGGRTGRVVAAVKLERKPGSETKSPAAPGAK